MIFIFQYLCYRMIWKYDNILGILEFRKDQRINVVLFKN